MARTRPRGPCRRSDVTASEVQVSHFSRSPEGTRGASSSPARSSIKPPEQECHRFDRDPRFGHGRPIDHGVHEAFPKEGAAVLRQLVCEEHHAPHPSHPAQRVGGGPGPRRGVVEAAESCVPRQRMAEQEARALGLFPRLHDHGQNRRRLCASGTTPNPASRSRWPAKPRVPRSWPPTRLAAEEAAHQVAGDPPRSPLVGPDEGVLSAPRQVFGRAAPPARGLRWPAAPPRSRRRPAQWRSIPHSVGRPPRWWR